MFKELRIRNEMLIEKYTEDKNDKELIKQKTIRELLKDEDCFNIIPVEDAFAILRDLGYDFEESKDLYVELTD